MIIRGALVREQRRRRLYPVSGKQKALHHLASFVTTRENPFKPHKHEGDELWYIIEGEAIVSLDGGEQSVESGDLVIVASGAEHGVRTELRAFWLCLG